MTRVHPILRVCKRCTFSAAHRLLNYKGACHNVHGHNYTVDVVMRFIQSNLSESGMVVDFKELKSKISILLDNYLDHSILLNKRDSLCGIMGDPVYNGKLLAFEGDPTVENISIYIMEKMKKLTEGYVSCELESVKVYETDTCFAEVQNVY